MSKRKGVFVTFGELVEDVSADATRFFPYDISTHTWTLILTLQRRSH